MTKVRNCWGNSTKRHASGVPFSLTPPAAPERSTMRAKGRGQNESRKARSLSHGLMSKNAQARYGGAKQNPLSKEGGFLFVLFTIHHSSFIIHLS